VAEDAPPAEDASNSQQDNDAGRAGLSQGLLAALAALSEARADGQGSSSVAAWWDTPWMGCLLLAGSKHPCACR
jgi:hypothetical protein